MRRKKTESLGKVYSGIKRLLLSISVLVLFVGMAGCSDEPEIPSLDPEVEETETGTLTSFSIEAGHFTLPDDVKVLSVALIGENGVVHTYNASVEKNGDIIRFSMEIPQNDSIENGTYVMTLSRHPGIVVPGRLSVRFEDNRVVSASPIAAAFPLKGSGTQTDPYQIGSDEDFEKFINAVNSDSQSYAAGLMFSQTADVNYTRENTSKGYACDKFAGIYNGGNHTLKLTIKGSSGASSGGGLFGELTGSASISDLNFSNTEISGFKNDCGIVAGKITGDVKISNISILGLVTGESNIGSVAGQCYGGTIVLSQVKTSANVKGSASNTGGLIGYVNNPKGLYIDNCTVSAGISGYQKVGGAFGQIQMKSSSNGINIDGLRIESSYGPISGGYTVGGLAGLWVADKNVTVTGTVEVSASVEGTVTETGGLFGILEDSEINVDNFTIGTQSGSGSMNVKGVENVGGIAGRINNAILSGSQIFDFTNNAKGVLGIPDPKAFRSSFNGMIRGENKVGGITGAAKNSSILHINCGATVTATGEKIGGIVGIYETSDTSHSMEDCTFTGTVTPNLNNNVGGIAGHLESLMSTKMVDCVNYSPINGGDNTGGIIGYLYKSHTYMGAPVIEINWVVNAASVEGGNNVGGIVGRAYTNVEDDDALIHYNINIANCMNIGTVTARGGNSEEGLGGIIGRTGALTQIYACANHGSVEAKGRLHAVGGIVGRLGVDPKLSRYEDYNAQAIECINLGSVNSTNRDNHLGGIAGYGEEGNRCGVTKCRNDGQILPDQKDDTGGIMGMADNYDFVTQNFNRGKVYHGNAILGTHKTFGDEVVGGNYFLEGTGGSWPEGDSHKVSQSRIADKSVYEGWDFDTVWEITPDGPNLRRNKWRDPASAQIP